MDISLESANMLQCVNLGVWSEAIADHLRKLTAVDYLTQWMIENYIRPCIKSCPRGAVPMLRDGVVDESLLLAAMAAAAAWRRSMTMVRQI
jgi:hypothetical protein